MELAEGDEQLRAALFRLVDVTPACRSLDDLARHLIGFLEEMPERPPALAGARGAPGAGRRDEGRGHEGRPDGARRGGDGRGAPYGPPVHRGRALAGRPSP